MFFLSRSSFHRIKTSPVHFVLALIHPFLSFKSRKPKQYLHSNGAKQLRKKIKLALKPIAVSWPGHKNIPKCSCACTHTLIELNYHCHLKCTSKVVVCVKRSQLQPIIIMRIIYACLSKCLKIQNLISDNLEKACNLKWRTADFKCCFNGGAITNLICTFRALFVKPSKQFYVKNFFIYIFFYLKDFFKSRLNQRLQIKRLFYCVAIIYFLMCINNNHANTVFRKSR